VNTGAQLQTFLYATAP